MIKCFVNIRKTYLKLKIPEKITLLFLEILVICIIGFLFFSNRYDKQILTVGLNVICIGFAFTLLSFILSSTKIQYTLNKVLSIGMVILLIMFLAFILAFFINLENKEESNDFYIYFVYDEGKNELVNIEKDYNRMWFFMSDYFNNFVSKDKNSDNSIQVNVNFFKDFLDFLIIRNLGFRYKGHWLIFIDNLPLSGTMGGPKDYKIPKKTIGENEIIGHEQNSLMNKVKVPVWNLDGSVSVPENTSVSLEKGVETGLLPGMDYSEESKNRTKRITIRNNYCTISLDTYFYGILPGEPFKDKVLTSCSGKCNIQVFAFKAKYKIEYSRFRMGTKNLINYYKPWAKDLCTSFQNDFDVQKKL